ncbi:MAG: SUF system Fe-S cluster assembly protein [Gammaproteobacteria bacterium]|nr:SUF system Fe-S cluster assembly protein [Gammaproteobacteria bacterium]
MMDIKRVFFKDKRNVEEQQNVFAGPVESSANTSLEQQVIAAIRTVYDPEIHINIYDLGLIYNISIKDEVNVDVDMTLTAPACPVAEILPRQVADVIKAMDGVNEVNVNLVWDPPWTQQSISDEARLELGLF